MFSKFNIKHATTWWYHKYHVRWKHLATMPLHWPDCVSIKALLQLLSLNNKSFRISNAIFTAGACNVCWIVATMATRGNYRQCCKILWLLRLFSLVFSKKIKNNCQATKQQELSQQISSQEEAWLAVNVPEWSVINPCSCLCKLLTPLLLTWIFLNSGYTVYM